MRSKADTEDSCSEKYWRAEQTFRYSIVACVGDGKRLDAE